MVARKINVGTQNQGKIKAVKNALLNYRDYASAIVSGCPAESGVSDQPLGFDETITGAKNRARQAFETGGADLGVGLESGIIDVPHTKSGYMDTTACAIYDGEQFHIGLSSCFEYPQEMIDSVIIDHKEVTDAAVALGFADDPGFRAGKGMIGILTRGVITRIQYSEQAVHTAMIHLLNPENY